MSEEAAVDNKSDRSGLTLFIVTLAAPLAGLVVGDLFSLDENDTKYVAVVTTAVPGAVSYLVLRKRRNPQKEAALLGQGILKRATGRIVTLLAIALLVVHQLVSFILGFVVGATLAIVGGPDAIDESTMLAVLGGVFLYVGIPSVMIAFFFISRHAGYYLEHPVRWALVSVLFYLVLNTAISIASGITVLETALGAALMGLPALAFCAWGAHSSKARKSKYMATKLFEKLDSDDQLAALGLLGEAAKHSVSDQVKTTNKPGLINPPLPAS